MNLKLKTFEIAVKCSYIGIVRVAAESKEAAYDRAMDVIEWTDCDAIKMDEDTFDWEIVKTMGY